MKKIIFTLVSFCLLYAQSNAQFCGLSGPSVCTPAGSFSKPGLYPVSDSLAPVMECDSAISVVIQFENYDTTTFGTSTVTIDYVKIDSINNLPAGLCWATDTSNNKWGNQENGCVVVSGTPTGPVGQYRLHIIADVSANGGTIPLTNFDVSGVGLFYYVRLVACGDNSPHPIDTTGQAAGTNMFESAGYVGINDVNPTVATISVVPNPFNNQATVSFVALKAGTMTERITNIIGEEVYSKEIGVVGGVNTHTIDRNNMSSGVYFYSITNGKEVYTKKLVITD